MISFILRKFGYVSTAETKAWQSLAADADAATRRKNLDNVGLKIRLTKVQAELDAIKRARSAAVAKGNTTRRLKREAAAKVSA